MIRFVILLSILITGLEMHCLAQDKDTAPIYVVIHIDVMPSFASPAAALLDSVRRESLKDAGAKSFKVLQEIGRSNHFTVTEEWADRKSYDTYISTAHMRRFRDRIQPMLGSPFDERLHIEIK